MKDLTTRKVEDLNSSFDEVLAARKPQVQNLSIYQSLAGFQQECPVIHKATKSYGYSYSDLPTIFGVINPLLAKYNLGFTQLIEGSYIKTVLFHTVTGETLDSVTSIPQDVALKGMNDFQVLGSAVTYIRRYALSSMLGIVTDKDTDAGGKQEPKKKTISDTDFKRGLDKMGATKFKTFLNDYEITKEQVLILNAKQF